MEQQSSKQVNRNKNENKNRTSTLATYVVSKVSQVVQELVCIRNQEVMTLPGVGPKKLGSNLTLTKQWNPDCSERQTCECVIDVLPGVGPKQLGSNPAAQSTANIQQ